MDCFETCGSNQVGLIDDNLITASPNIGSELDCKRSCVTHGGCSWYTYFFGNDTLNHGYCFLLTELIQPTELSNTASSGPGKCSANSPSSTTSTSTTTTSTTTPTSSCRLQIVGHTENGNGYQLMGTDQTYNISVIGLGSCTLRLLAVGGGGGKPDSGSVYTGGAGSGYITYRTFIVQGGQAWMTANVGDQQEPSTVTLHYNPGMYTTITAERFVSLCCVFSVSISVS